MRAQAWATCVLSCFALGAAGQEAPQPTASQPTQPATPTATGFLYRTVTVGQRTCAYCVYIPPEYTPERRWPVILFLHGSGERGVDGFRQTDVGIARTIRRHRQLCPAIVVMPQCRPGHWWDEAMLKMALRCVEDTSAQYHCDPDRIYLTGISMGGAGVWELARQMPNAFAAVVPICGFYGQPDRPAAEAELRDLAERLVGLPIRCFHGAMDTNVPVARTREVVAALEEAGAKVTYTELPQGRHNIWNRVYDNPALWRWLLAQRRSPRTRASP